MENQRNSALNLRVKDMSKIRLLEKAVAEQEKTIEELQSQSQPVPLQKTLSHISRVSEDDHKDTQKESEIQNL